MNEFLIFGRANGAYLHTSSIAHVSHITMRFGRRMKLEIAGGHMLNFGRSGGHGCLN